jgi:excisionase family DNA binding protein
MAEEEMLKVPEIAARMRVSEYTVRRWLRLRRLRGIMTGRKAGWRIPVSEYERFIREEMGAE